ncbi:sulfatase-like hydrolase/transferase [Carboxylicivirga taeanensis]|uniref:sulfatase family protein n=1 Tax=Carboxylicivirga taeanensis TaxID=1416875 RepID=UPI003F6DD0B4
MKKIIASTAWLLVLCLFAACHDDANNRKQPNVVMIYADDIGYSDVGVYGAALIPTPNIDKLAAEGIRFTDGHCAASTCSPSRYALLTGEMGFRKKITIQPVNAPALIQPGQFTLGSLFQQAGYQTAIIGKWHLGLGNGNMDWNKKITAGPNDVGFDYSFIIPSSNDRSPFVFVENDKVYKHDPNDPITVSLTPIHDSIPGTKYPDALENPESITVYQGDKNHQCSVINGVGRIGYMKGGKKALWKDVDIADNLVDKAKNFINRNDDKPFFLLLTTNDIHAPRLPHPRFKGATTLGYRGDNVVQLDWCVGQITELLKEKGLEENTIVIFSSDNGPVFIDGGYEDGSNEGGHDANGIYRGGKYSIYEGGTRVPFIIKWPGKIKPQVSSALVSQVDMLASFAHYFNITVPNITNLDTRNYWNALMGIDKKGAHVLIEQMNSDRGLALRKDHMKYIYFNNRGGELYDLDKDPSEENNILEQHPELSEKLHNELMRLKENHLNTVYGVE